MDPTNRNPLFMPATSAEAGPVQLPTNPNFVRTAGVTDASAIEESEKQFAQHVNQELTDVQPQQTSRHTKRAKTGNKDATEFESAAAETQAMPDLEGEADAEMPAADEKAKPPWNGKVIGLGKAKKDSYPHSAFVWFYNNVGYPDTENREIKIDDLSKMLKRDAIPPWLAKPKKWAAGECEEAARRWLVNEAGLAHGRRVAVEFYKNMDNATVVEFHQSGNITVEYDDETEEYTSWDPLKPKKPWRLIEVGLDDPEDLKKQVVDGSDPDSD